MYALPTNLLLVFRWITRNSLPPVSRRNGPISMKIILPIRISNNFLLSSDKYVYRTHPIFLFGASANPGEWSDTIVDDHSDLGPW